MDTAKLITDGDNQAVRLPGSYRIEGDEVYVKKAGNVVILIPKNDPWSLLKQSLEQFSDDFMEKREQPPHQKHEPVHLGEPE